jgi:pentatricopeptide repeat protein
MLAEAEKLFEEMETKSVLPDVYTYTYLVDSCFKEARVEDTMQYFYKMADGREHGPKFNISFFNLMFEGLTEAGRIDDALKVYGRMPDKEIKPNAATFEILVKALCKEGDLDRARDLVRDMARGAVEPPQELRESVINIFKKSDRQEEIEKAFEEKPLPKPQPRTENQPRTDYRPHNAVGVSQGRQSPVQSGFGYSQSQQPAFKDTQNQQPGFDSSRQWHSGFGAPQVQHPGYGAPQPAQAVAGPPQPPRAQFGASQAVPGYSTSQVGYGSQLPQLGYGFAPHQEQVGFGNQVAHSPPPYTASQSQSSHNTHWSQSGYGSPQGQLGYGGAQGLQHASHLPHHQADFGMPQVQNNNGFPRVQQQSNFARDGQTAVGRAEDASKFGGSYGQPRNDNSEGPPRFGAQTDHRYSTGYRASYGTQGFNGPRGEYETASKDQSDPTTSEDRQRVAF